MLEGRANLYVVRVMTDGVALGPILMGVNKPAHVLTQTSTPRRW